MALISYKAKFYDGETAQPYQVIVELYRTNLFIKTLNKSLERNWPYNEIKMLEQPEPPQPARLTSRKTPHARLYIEPENWRHLKAKLPKNAFPGITLSTSWNYLIGYAGLSVTFILATVLFGPKLFEYASYIIPHSTEEKIGQLAIESSINDPVCVAPQGRASLKKMVQKLQQGMKRDTAFNVRIVSDDETLNALAAPGGHLVIFSGVLKKADSVDEVAAVLAHEMAHIEMNHPMKSLTRNLGLSLTLQMMFGDTSAISSTAKLAGIFNQLHYSRQDELEADLVGQDLLRKAGIDPSGLRLFFDRLQHEEAKRSGTDKTDFPEFLTYFSTHPHTQVRINNLKTNEISATDYKKALNEIEWQALKNICNVKQIISEKHVGWINETPSTKKPAEQ